MDSTEEVGSRWLEVMEEDRSIVHLVLENSLAFVLLEIDLSEQVDFITTTFQHKLSKGSNVTSANILCG